MSSGFVLLKNSSFFRTQAVGFQYETYGEISSSRTLSYTLRPSAFTFDKIINSSNMLKIIFVHISVLSINNYYCIII